MLISYVTRRSNDSLFAYFRERCNRWFDVGTDRPLKRSRQKVHPFSEIELTTASDGEPMRSQKFLLVLAFMTSFHQNVWAADLLKV